MARRWVVLVERDGSSYAGETFADAVEVAMFDGPERFDVRVVEAPDAGAARVAYAVPGVSRGVLWEVHASAVPAWVPELADAMVRCSAREWRWWVEGRWVLEEVVHRPGAAYPYHVTGRNYAARGEPFSWSVPDVSGWRWCREVLDGEA